MIGKILLVLLAAILLTLTVLLLIPLQIHITYQDKNLAVWLRYGAKQLALHPAPEKDQTPETASGAKESAEKAPEKKTAQKPNREQISYSLDVLPGILLRALRTTGRRIIISPLKLHVLVAASDPADTAVLYGRLEGIFGAVLPSLHRKVRIREQDIRLFPDFCGEQTDLIVDAGIRIRPWDLLAVALFAAGGLFKWYLGYKKRSDRTEVKKKKRKTAAYTESVS